MIEDFAMYVSLQLVQLAATLAWGSVYDVALRLVSRCTYSR